ncbi:MAG: cysteine desulfurase [Methylococcales symbiont of Hymedesmia sp. n. MRB-2018]|nr:MAG: cysteine desulfurase [Methylococcales symbiont of Hymedesmia sp. n. MRB-2018]KAF3982666.1 MAG: cysteine desulfurase [Methylococcales symbiont of Hymedesmia sp. n. MRB-2018]
MIYFDHNATTPIDQRVVEAMLPYLTTFYGNPSSLYRMGRAVRSAIDIAREQVAALVDALPEQIVFTSGGTEANNLALQTLSDNATVAISNIEHPSILEAVNNKKISRLHTITVDKNGLVLPEAIEVFLQKYDSIDLVSIMLANNENGAIQDISPLTKLNQNKNFIVHTDAIQAIGKIPVSFQQLEVDLMSLSSHKIYGPKGCGALVINKNITVSPLLIGGGQENGWRAGTENVAAIVGFGKAAELAQQELEYRSSHYLDLRNSLEKELSSIENLFVFAKDAPRLSNTVQFGIKDVNGEMLLMQLDQKNIAVSSGSACSSGAGKASSVLTAMGVENKLAKSAIRISLGQANTKQDVNEFIQTLKLLLNK